MVTSFEKIPAPEVTPEATQGWLSNLRPKALEIAEARAHQKSISLYQAVSDLVEEAGANPPSDEDELRRQSLPALSRVMSPGALEKQDRENLEEIEFQNNSGA